MSDLYCALCLHIRHGIANNATTIADGTAVCLSHLGDIIRDGSFAAAVVNRSRSEEAIHA